MNKLFILSALALILCMGFSSAAISPTDSKLNSYWGFNVGGSSTVAPNENNPYITLNATLFSNTLWSSIRKLGNYSSSYGAGGQYTSVGGVVLPNTNWTVNVWVNRTISDSNDRYIFAQGTQSNNQAIFGGVLGSTQNLSLSIFGVNILGKSVTNDINQWHMYTFMWNSANNTAIIYRDGVFSSSYGASAINIATPNSFHIGAREDVGGTGSWSGYIDEMLIMNRTLTDSEISGLYNNGEGLAYPFSFLVGVNLTYPSNNAGLTSVSGQNFNATASMAGGTAVNSTRYLYTNAGVLISTNFTNIIYTGNKTNFTIPNLADGAYKWNIQMCGSDSSCSFAPSNFTFTIDSNAPTVNGDLPANRSYIYSLNSTTSQFQINVTATDSLSSIDKVWYTSTWNSTPTFVTNAALTTVTLNNVFGKQEIYKWANDTAGNVGMNASTISVVRTTYDSSLLSGTIANITTNISTFYPLTGTILNYNNVNTTVTINQDAAGNYLIYSTITAPTVSTTTQIPFFYYFTSNGNQFLSTSRNQTVNPVVLNTTCGAGSYTFANITNYDEENLSIISGTVEYALVLQNNNVIIGATNGTLSGTNLRICSSQNLTSTSAIYSLQLRYYANNYMYETYNIQQSSTSSLPISIPLYFERNDTGTEFTINYIDFNYIKHPNAIIQVQRQYLTENVYRVVEIPLIDQDGSATAAFNTRNVKYKLIVMENGQILDIFENVFPICQSIVLGQCNIPIRGVQSTQTSSNGNFEYTFSNANNSLIMTYVISDGTPSTVTLITNQSSAFISQISTCSSSVNG